MNADNDTTGHLNAHEPAQVLQAFLAAHSIDQVKLTLLAALQGYALNEQQGFLDINVKEEELADLFDHLVDLVAAVQELTAQGKITGIPVSKA